MFIQTIFVIGFAAIATAKICNILSFTGGGAFGALEVGIFSQIALKEYDMITGVSAGGLNAGFLSYYNDGKMEAGIDHLTSLYTTLKNSDVYEYSIGDLFRTWSYYDTTPLRNTLSHELEKIINKSILSSGHQKTTLIGATNLNAGQFEIFSFHDRTKKEQINLLMATSAIPILFPPQQLTVTVTNKDEERFEDWYVDGGLIANEIITGLEGYFPKKDCQFFNITLIASAPKINSVKTIDTMTDYLERILQVAWNDFDNELAEIVQNKCQFPRGQLHHCFTTANHTQMEKYSMLDFSHGKELIDIGQNAFFCEKYNYC